MKNLASNARTQKNVYFIVTIYFYLNTLKLATVLNSKKPSVQSAPAES